MSVFALNYLNDISEYDQSLTDLKQREANKLKQKFKMARSTNLQVIDQTINKQKNQSNNDRISEEQTKILKELINLKLKPDDDLNFYFRGVSAEKLNKNSKIKHIDRKEQKESKNQNQNLQQNQSNDLTKQQNLQEKINTKQQIYLKIIQRRNEKLKKTEKRGYFMDNLGA